MGFQGPLGWEELAMNVHEDINSSTSRIFACRADLALSLTSSGIALSTNWGLENKEPSTQAETWGCSAAAQI